MSLVAGGMWQGLPRARSTDLAPAASEIGFRLEVVSRYNTITFNAEPDASLVFDTTWQQRQLWTRHTGASAPIPAPPADPKVEGASLLFWEEHCVECSIPECYTTCRLYVARADQKCARFVYGIARNPGAGGLFNYGADVSFRRWGKLEAQLHGAPQLYRPEDLRGFDAWERRLEAVANATASALQPVNPKRRVNGLLTYLRNRWLARQAVAATTEAAAADAFYVKVFNPGTEAVPLSIEFHQGTLVHRDVIPATPGWSEVTIPVERIGLAPDKAGRILVAPANDQEARLVFTWLDFVRFAVRPEAATNGKATPKPAGKVKCVVWDLDNTLWRGVIGDDGPDGVQMHGMVADMIRALDERGIVQSIASKNTYDVAWPKIESLGLADYFLYPAIHWGPKSRSLQLIADELNINVDTLALVDDSAFERAEVSGRLPQARVYDVTELEGLLERPEFAVPVTEASRARRLSYLAEAQRKRVAAGWTDDLDGFLRSCEMRLEIGRPGEQQLDRCLELIERTNQLNLSTRRFSAEELRALVADPSVDCFALRCRDRFGDYGLVGFASVERHDEVPVLRDFVLSCRVAQKRVEETFVYWYARQALDRGANRLRAVLVATDRNQPLRDTLRRMPFEESSADGRTTVLELPLREPLTVPDIIQVEPGG